MHYIYIRIIYVKNVCVLARLSAYRTNYEEKVMEFLRRRKTEADNFIERERTAGRRAAALPEVVLSRRGREGGKRGKVGKYIVRERAPV